MSDIFFQIVLAAIGIVIGISVPLLPTDKQKNIAKWVTVTTIAIAILWTGYELGVRASSKSSSPSPVLSTETAFVAIAPTATVQLQPTIEPQPTLQTMVTQTPIASDCLSTDYIPEITGFHPPIDTLICIPSGIFVYISSDPARISIPSINYDNTFTAGYTFKFFGPVKFIISGVSTKYIWMEARYDTNLLTKLDEKALNLVYQNGKVCDLSLYTGSACP
jgi:hypothetical protein